MGFPSGDPLNSKRILNLLEEKIGSSEVFQDPSNTDSWIDDVSKDTDKYLEDIGKLRYRMHYERQLKSVFDKVLSYTQLFIKEYNIKTSYDGNTRQLKAAGNAFIKPPKSVPLYIKENKFHGLCKSDSFIDIVEYDKNGQLILSIPIIFDLKTELNLSRMICWKDEVQKINFKENQTHHRPVSPYETYPDTLTSIFRQVLMYMKNAGLKTIILSDGRSLLLLKINIEATMKLGEKEVPADAENAIFLKNKIKTKSMVDDSFTTFAFEYAVFDIGTEKDVGVTIQASLLAVLLSLASLPKEDLILSKTEYEFVKKRFIQKYPRKKIRKRVSHK